MRVAVVAAMPSAVHRAALLIALPSALLSACSDEAAPLDPPVEASALCAEVARVVCEADGACFPGAEGDDCRDEQVARCDEVLQPLVDDPRLGYDAHRAGTFLRVLGARADACWEEPVDYASFVHLFAGTGALGADCTPARLDAASLRASALSCADGAACRLYLRADGSHEGVCEARRDDACSHAFDCEPDAFCSLPSRWQPGVWGECRPLRADGWTCTRDLECASRHCDGTCRPRPELARRLRAPYADVVRDAEPLAYLRFDGTGTSAPDASGNGHTGQLAAGAVRAAEGAIEGDESGALALAGEGQHARIPGLGVLGGEGAEMTLECWFRRDDVEGASPLLELSDAERLGAHVWNHDRGDKVFANFVGDESAEHPVMSGEGAVSASSWHHVVATFDGAMGRLYLDGRAIGETAVGDPLQLGDTLLVGFRPAIGEREARSFVGLIDEVAVYDHALDAATVRRHHAAGVAGALENEFPLFAWLH